MGARMQFELTQAQVSCGHTSTAMLNELNRRRLQFLLEQKVHETNERITSIDNDVADLLSRDRVQDALRYALDCDMQCIQLHAEASERQLPVLQ